MKTTNTEFKMNISFKLSIFLIFFANFLNEVIEAREEASAIWLSNPGKLSTGNEKLDQLLKRRGPNFRASADYHDFTDMEVGESIEAWKLMAEKSQLFARNQLEVFKPKIMTLLKDSNTSQSCQKASLETITALENLDTWSVQSK